MPKKISQETWHFEEIESAYLNNRSRHARGVMESIHAIQIHRYDVGSISKQWLNDFEPIILHSHVKWQNTRHWTTKMKIVNYLKLIKEF